MNWISTMKHYEPRKKTYSSLTQLKEEMESKKKKPKNFTGYSLELNGYVYGLYCGQIGIWDKKTNETIKGFDYDS